MSLEGKIVIRLRRGEPVQIESSRPLDFTRRLAGLSPEALLDRVPLLYALCGKAQHQAAQLALRAAEPAVSQRTAADVYAPTYGVVIEAALEYLWRFAIDLPQWAQQPPVMAPFAALRKALLQPSMHPTQAAELLQDYLQQQLLHEPLQDWSARSLPELQRWLQGDSPAAELLRAARELERSLNKSVDKRAGGSVAPPLPLLPAAPSVAQLQQWGTAMAQPAYCAEPSWQARCHETGALAYQQHHPWIMALLGAGESRAWLRLLARLLELAELVRALGDLNAPAAICGNLVLQQAGTGLGWVKTARGILLHRASLKAESVTGYAILAPTEWNFHPQGALAVALTGWEQCPSNLLQRWVALQVISLDPCVGYQLEVYDA